MKFFSTAIGSKSFRLILTQVLHPMLKKLGEQVKYANFTNIRNCKKIEFLMEC